MRCKDDIAEFFPFPPKSLSNGGQQGFPTTMKKERSLLRRGPIEWSPKQLEGVVISSWLYSLIDLYLGEFQIFPKDALKIINLELLDSIPNLEITITSRHDY